MNQKRSLTTSTLLAAGIVIAGYTAPISEAPQRPVDAPPDPIVRSVAPRPTSPPAAPSVAPAQAIGTALVSGIASLVPPSWGAAYLALPEGPGVEVTICHASRCIARVSTDAGPSLALQRAGRVADLSFADFQNLCQCSPYLVGLIPVTVETGSVPTIPPTDSEGTR